MLKSNYPVVFIQRICDTDKLSYCLQHSLHSAMALYIKIAISNCLLQSFIVASRRNTGGKNAACGLNDKGLLPQPISFIFCDILLWSFHTAISKNVVGCVGTLRDKTEWWSG